MGVVVIHLQHIRIFSLADYANNADYYLSLPLPGVKKEIVPVGLSSPYNTR
jgi:hypothetical protein